MIYIIGMACMTGTLSAQTVVDYSTFEQKVLDYSQTLKQSVAQRTAMQKAMKAAKTAFFPAVDATGSYQYRINKYEMDFGGMAVPMEHDSYSAEVGVVTTYLCRWKHLSQLQGFPNTNPDGG